MANHTVGQIQKNIKFYRKQKGLTQEELSELANISCDYLSEIERGKKIPSIKRLLAIADVLNISAYKFLI